ncbi:MAG: PH domain-containing protein [Syntrophomonas sp.]|nr:PH domain-containing protein [Syntrophomonas sp.]
MTYRPKQAYGGWIGLLLGLIIFGFIFWGINYSLDDGDRSLKIVLYIPTVLFLLIHVFLVLGAFCLRYKMEADALIINFGLYRKRITWKQFNKIMFIQGQSNFNPILTVSWPGLMVGLHTVNSLGSIKMFADNANDGFILLKTQAGSFGITPEKDEELLTILLNNTGQELHIVDMNQMPREEKGISIKEDRVFRLYYKLNIIFLALFAGYISVFFPGSGAPKMIVLLVVLALALFGFNTDNAKRLFQFSTQGAYITLLLGLGVTGMFFILSFIEISLK